MYAKIKTNSSNDGSDSDSSQDLCDSNVNDDEDDSSSENIASLMLTMALVPEASIYRSKINEISRYRDNTCRKIWCRDF